MTTLRKPTLRDVARLAQVSEQTVSNVMNERPNVRAETREKVLQAAETLNYRANRLARSLKTSRSNVLAVIFPALINPIYAEAADVVSRAATRRGYLMMLANSQRDPEAERQLVETALDHQVAGLLLSSIDPTGAAGRRAPRFGVPCVQLLNRDPCWTGDYVGAANVAAAREAVATLVADGHRTIGHLRGLVSFVGDERLRGYRDAIVEAGLPLDEALVAPGHFSRKGGAQAFAQLVERNPGMTAVFCGSDLMAYGVLDEARRRGIRVPQDMSVVGFDDTSFSSLGAISLTTVRFDLEAIASAAVDRLIDRVEGRVAFHAEAMTKIFGCTLVRRGSTTTRNAEAAGL